MQYGKLYHRNFYKEVTEKNRVHYEYYNLGTTENVPEDYTEISFVCLREDGCLELPATVETACRTAARKVPELEGVPLPHIKAHLHNKPVIKRGTAKRCAGTFRTLGRKHYHKCLCTRYKGGNAGICKALGQGCGNELGNYSSSFNLAYKYVSFQIALSFSSFQKYTFFLK